MNAVNIKTVAGCDTRLTVNVTAPEGVTTALTGFVRVQGVPQPAQVTEPGVLLLPACEPGEYLYEVRAGECIAARGHLLVRHSAFPPGGTVDAQIDADLTQCGGVFAVTLTEGARGKQGEDGQPGKDGKDGKDGATPEAVAAFYAHNPQYVDKKHLTTSSAGGNASFIAARFRAPDWLNDGAGSTLKSISMVCRSSGSVCDKPMYLVLSVLRDGEWTPAVTSINACVQQPGEAAEWSFGSTGIIVHAGELVEVQASYSRPGDTTDNAWVGCLAAADNAGQCQSTNGTWSNMVPVMKVVFNVPASPVFLTPEQSDLLTELLTEFSKTKTNNLGQD